MRNAFRFARAFVVLVWLTSVAQTAHAQLPQNSALVGRITDEAGLPVAGVQVAVSGARLLTTAITTETTSSGEFRVDGLPPGPYALVVRAAGFQPISRGDVV